MTADLTAAQTFEPHLSTLEAQLTDVRNRRDAAYIKVWNNTKGARSYLKRVYGDDASQYELGGGTRKSERKLPKHKPKLILRFRFIKEIQFKTASLAAPTTSHCTDNYFALY